MIRTILSLMLCSVLTLVLACDESVTPPEPTIDANAPGPVVDHAQADVPAAVPTETVVEDLRTTQPVVAPPRTGPQNPFGPAPAPTTEEAAPTGRERDIGSLRTTQPVQRPLTAPPNP